MQEELEVIPVTDQADRQPTLEVVVVGLRNSVFQSKPVISVPGLMVDPVVEEDKEMVLHLLH